MRSDLISLTEELMIKGGLLEQNIPLVKPTLEEAQQHADDLRIQAERLNRLVTLSIELSKMYMYIREWSLSMLNNTSYTWC